MDLLQMNVDEFLSLVKSGGSGSERREKLAVDNAGIGSRKRPREPERQDGSVKSGIMKRPNVEKVSVQPTKEVVNTSNNASNNLSGELEISEEERIRILQMVEDEPEVGTVNCISLARFKFVKLTSYFYRELLLTTRVLSAWYLFWRRKSARIRRCGLNSQNSQRSMASYVFS